MVSGSFAALTVGNRIGSGCGAKQELRVSRGTEKGALVFANLSENLKLPMADQFINGTASGLA